MRNFKKILLVLCVCAILFAGCAIAVFATDEYTGTVEDLTPLVEMAETSVGAANKLTALKGVKSYIDATPVDPAAEGYEALIARAQIVALDCFDLYVEEANKSGVTLETAKASIASADEAWNLFELPDTLEGYADSVASFDTAVVKCANLLLAKIDDDIENTLKTATNRVAINNLNAFLKKYPLKASDATVAYADLYAELDKLVAAHEKAVNKNLEALDAENEIGDYSLDSFANIDFQSTKLGQIIEGNVEIFGIQSNGSKNVFKIAEEENGNRYLNHTYITEPKANSYIYLNLGTKKDGGGYAYEDDNGFVFSFKFTTFDRLPNSNFNVEAGGVNMASGRNFPPFYLTIDTDGNLIGGGNTASTFVMLPNAVVPGEWIDIMIVFDVDSFTHNVYVDGDKIGSCTAKYQGESYDFNEGGAHIRFSSSDVVGSFAIDDFNFYAGSNYRILDKFSKMTDDEKFLYYADYFTDDTRDINGRNIAYTTAGSILYKYWTWIDEENGVGEYTEYAKANEDLKNAVDKYVEFDFEALLVYIKETNLDKYVQMVTEIDALERSTALGNRNLKAAAIDEFALEYADLINKELDKDSDGRADYYQYSSVYSRVRQEMLYDSNATYFIRYMNRFATVTAYTALERYYIRARELVDGDGLDLSVLNGTADLTDAEKNNFKELLDAYEVYQSAADHIAYVNRYENSAKIIACMNFISEYQTEEEWLANYDFVYKYLTIVKPIVLENNGDGTLKYDENYEGVDEAITFFHAAYDYCYGVLQENHIQYLNGILESIANNDAYIEKMGMVAMMDRYFLENDINYNDPRINDIINNLETCRAELELREEDYAKILYQNGVYFVNLVEKIRTAEEYVEKKALFEEASLLYFNMDITVEGATRAVAIYDEVAAELAIIDESSQKFLDAVAVYKACETDDERYAALVECYRYAGHVEMSYAGATEAMAFYQAEYEAYMNYVEATNGEIAASGNAVGSMRANCGVSTIIAIIIKKIYEE